MGGEVFLGGKAGAFWERFQLEPLHRLTAVPLVLSGPLCRFGTSPHPRGESPLSEEAFEVDGEKCLI